jgi:hypothetical protein
MKRITLLLSFCTLLACEGLPSDPNGLRAFADRMESRQESYDKAYDNWGSGDVASTYTAYLDGSTVAFIEEHMTRGTSGRSINRYYFYNDQLFCYRESRNNSDSTHVDVEVVFDAQGEVLVAQQKLNNQPVATDAYSPSMARKHSQTLRELARHAPVMQ